MNDDLSEAQFESGRKRKLTEHHAGNILACSETYFGRAKAACLCSYCCNRHLCYDGGRLGRVKIVTLRVGARAKEGKRGGGGEKIPLLLPLPIFSPLFKF